MRNIAFIELDTHSEIASNFMELMRDSQDFSVDYFFTDKIIRQLGVKENSNIIKTTHREIELLLSRKHYDLVIIGTVHRYFNIFKKITEKYNTAVIVHNLNFSKTSKTVLLKSVFKEDVLYRLKLLVKEGLLCSTGIHKKANHLLVLDENLSDRFHIFLPVFYCAKASQKNRITRKIVIPGTVSQARRNYKSVLEKLKNISEKTEVVLLGKASGEELENLQQFEASESNNVILRYFTEKVPSEVFAEEISGANLLWCPVQRETSFFSIKEIYGETKMSGNIGDAVKFGKPAVFPAEYNGKYPFVIPEEPEVERFFLKLRDFNSEVFKQYQKKNISELLHKVLNRLC